MSVNTFYMCYYVIMPSDDELCANKAKCYSKVQSDCLFLQLLSFVACSCLIIARESINEIQDALLYSEFSDEKHPCDESVGMTDTTEAFFLFFILRPCACYTRTRLSSMIPSDYRCNWISNWFSELPL